MYKSKYVFLFTSVFFIIMMSALNAQTGLDVFEHQKQIYMDSNGTICRYYHERIWAWLEKMKTGEIDGKTYLIKDVTGVTKPVIDIVHNIIQSWGTINNSTYKLYDTSWRWAEWWTSTSLVWIFLGYGDVIYPSDKQFLINLYSGYIKSRDFAAGAHNSQLHDMVGRYLYSQYYKNVEVQFSYDPPPSPNIKSFSWAGTVYETGKVYKAYDVARDWIYYKMKYWIRDGNNEFDSPAYTWCMVHAFSALYEFAQDPEMKRKAKMMVDFILLESALDFTAQQWGGGLGRTYEGNIVKAQSRFYWHIFWGGIRPSHEPPHSILVSSYRLPEVIWDICDLSDEPDNYYHINMENNSSLVRVPGSGIWNYVTKFFSLGGGRGSEWQLCILSDDEPGRYNRLGVPFRMWINTKDVGEDVAHPVSYMAYLTMGENGFQYKNAIFTHASIFHYSIYENSFDIDVQEGDWRFFKEGRVMVAMQIRENDDRAGMEVAIEGVDYVNFSAFKNSVRNNADLSRYNFTTSKGDILGVDKRPAIFDNIYFSIVKKNGASQFEYVWDFPFQRVQTIDYLGRWMVQWNNSRMSLRKQDKQLVYDFNNWSVTESTIIYDETPPARPSFIPDKPVETISKD